jgi:hypothetical protein
MFVAAPAWSQAPSAGAPPAPGTAQAPAAKTQMPVGKDAGKSCPECAEVRSIRQVTKELPQEPATQSQPTGLVASIPLGGGKPKVGSSTKHGHEAVRTSSQWEVTLRYDDGRYRLFMLDKQPDFAQGDKVRVDARGQITPR